VLQYKVVFDWNYKDMAGLDPQIAMYCLNIDPDAKLAKQQHRRFCPEIMEAIESEIKKLIDSDFCQRRTTSRLTISVVLRGCLL